MKVAGGGPSVHAYAVFLRAESRDGDYKNGRGGDSTRWGRRRKEMGTNRAKPFLHNHSIIRRGFYGIIAAEGQAARPL